MIEDLDLARGIVMEEKVDGLINEFSRHLEDTALYLDSLILFDPAKVAATNIIQELLWGGPDAGKVLTVVKRSP